MPRLVPHPYQTVLDPPEYDPQIHSSIRKSYINCIGSNPSGREKSAHAEGIDDYHELPTGHDAMVTIPKEVSELLQKIVA